MVILVMLIVIRLRIPTNRATEIMAAIAALKGQFVGHCYHSIVFSKGPQTFFGNFLG